MIHKPSSYDWKGEAPPLRRRHRRRYVVISVAAMGMMIVPFLLIDFDVLIGPGWTAVVSGSFLLSMLVLVYVVQKPYRQLMKRLVAADFKLCPECGYRLTGLSDQTDCPECGTACDLEEVEAMWRGFRTKIVARRQ